MRQGIELRIEELVLHGFGPGDRYSIGDAVERELSHLFAEEGVPPLLLHGGNVPHLDVGALKVSPGTKADAVGARVARALYKGMLR